MTEALAKNFAVEDFNAEKFVKELSTQCVGADELRQQRAKIQELASSTSAQLKRNVYQNYIQFIETAKEISHLESEMYQLSQLLSEQRSLLNSLGTNRCPGNVLEESSEIEEEDVSTFVSKEEESKQKLMTLLENVEGAMSLAEVAGRVCLHEGSLLELDPLEGTPLKQVHAYLFNDILMIASWLSNSNKRGPPRYKMQVVYDLKSLAVVNVRDLGSVKLAFKLLAFPDTRVFQCTTATSKKEWLEKCDQAKKLRISQESQPEKVDEVKSTTRVEQLVSASRSISLESNDEHNQNEADIYESLPEWILEVTEDLDSCIAQRHFEEAYNLLTKARTFMKNTPAGHQLNEIKLKLDTRSNSLINVLTKELEMSAEAKSLQGGGLKSARRAVKLLIQLNRSAQACQLYLRLCSTALKARLKRVKREGATVPYVKQLSAIAYSNITEMIREFLKIFPPSSNCNSALAVWCSHELKLVASHLIKQIFIPQVSLNTLVECIIMIREHCEQLSQIGVDFRYQLDGQLRAPLVRVLQDTREKCVDAVRVRAAEDNWRPTNFQTAQQLRRLLSELDDLGIPLPEAYVRNEHSIPLTNNTVTFSKLYIGLLEDCLNVATSETIHVIEEILMSVLQIQVQHIKKSLANPKLKLEKKLILDNSKYICDVILIRTLELHRSATGHSFKELMDLQDQLRSESSFSSSKPRPAPRTSVTKYSTTEYI